MIVSITENKYQILISTLIGFLYYLKNKDETIATLLVLGSAAILRSLNIDKFINNYLKKESYINFKTQSERNQFCKSLFNASNIASQDEKAKLWNESKEYLSSLKKTKEKLALWNKKFQKSK